jgi:hypothetical protein
MFRLPPSLVYVHTTAYAYLLPFLFLVAVDQVEIVVPAAYTD